VKKLLLIFSMCFLGLNNVFALDIETKIEELKKEVDHLVETRLDKTYPIGSIYITTVYSDISQIEKNIGGKWEKYGNGRTLVGVDENDSNFNEINKIGGNTTTTLSTTNLPSHSHEISKLSGKTSTDGSHTHARGTMNITGVLNIRSYNGEYHDTIVGTSGAFSKTVTNWSGTHDGLQRVTLNPGFYHSVNFDAKNSWTGVTTADGNHSHSITTNASTTGNGSGDMTPFTNLQPYITVYMYKRIA